MLPPGAALSLVGVVDRLCLCLGRRVQERDWFHVAGRDVQRPLPLIDQPLAA